MAMPHNVQVAPDGKSVWATSMGMNSRDNESVVVIDPFTNQIIRRVYLGSDLHVAHVVLDDASNFAFITAYEGNKVFQIDAHSYSVIDTIELDSLDGPHGMRYSNGKLYIANMNSKSMSIIDVSTAAITNVPLGGIAVQTAVTKNQRYVFATLFDTKEVARYTVSTGQITKIQLPSEALSPIQAYPSPDSRYLYVCDQGGLLGRPSSNKVFVIDVENASVIHTIVVGAKAHGVVLSQNGKYAFVTNTDDNTLSVIETSNQNVIGTIPTSYSPNGISFWYGTGGMP